MQGHNDWEEFSNYRSPGAGEFSQTGEDFSEFTGTQSFADQDWRHIQDAEEGEGQTDDLHVIMSGGAAGGFYYPGCAGDQIHKGDRDNGLVRGGGNIGQWQQWPNVNVPDEGDEISFVESELFESDVEPEDPPLNRKQLKKLQALLVHTARYIAEFDKPPRLLTFTVSVHFLRYIFVPLLSPLVTLIRSYAFDSQQFDDRGGRGMHDRGMDHNRYGHNRYERYEGRY